MRLVLGFQDVAYKDIRTNKSPLPKTTKHRLSQNPSKAQLSYGEGKTTLGVALSLEERYKIVETFYDMEEDFIINLIEEQMEEELNEVLTMETTATQIKGLSTEETDKIETRFKQNLRRRRYDGVIPGVPTQTSLKGVSHLFMKPYARHGFRPSFIDTGLYMNSFREGLTHD
jgi:hypothetical protein